MKHINRLMVATLTGIITGLLGLLFLNSFKLYNKYVIYNDYNFVFPIIGGLLLSIIWYFIGDGNKHFGSKVVKDEIESINMQIISLKDAVIKFAGTIISICTGFIMGKVGFFIHLGGAVGSNIAYRITEDNNERKLIITSGVAGALAAITGSVPFAVLFVIEVYYIKNISFNRVVYPLIISAISGYAIVHFLFNKVHIIRFPVETMDVSASLVYAVVVGFIASILGILMSRYIPFLKEMHNKKMPFFAPIIGGFILSIIGYYYPEFFKLFVLDFSSSFNYILMLALLFIGVSISMLFGAIGGEFTVLVVMGALIGAIINPTGVVIVLGISGVLSAFYGAGFSVLVLFASTEAPNLIIPVAITIIIGVIIHEIFHEKIEKQNT